MVVYYSIEDEMMADRKLTFESALYKVYNRFPITGFASFINAKTEGMQKLAKIV